MALSDGWRHVTLEGCSLSRPTNWRCWVVCDNQWNPVVAVRPCPWDESFLSPDVRCSIDLVLDKKGFRAMIYEVGLQFSGTLLEIVIG